MPKYRNHLVGIVLAAVAVYGSWWSGMDLSFETLALAGFSAYLLGVILDAWIRITLYWYRRGTRHAKRWTCGGCGRRIHRKSGDWILECKSCGWKPGLPVLRWFWHSVPVIEARRRRLFGGAIRTGIAAIVLVGIVLTPVAVSMCNSSNGCPAVVDSLSESVPDIEYTPESTPSEITTRERTVASTAAPDNQPLDTGQLERAIHRSVNRERAESGLSRLNFDANLANIARSHSQDMAARGYFSHTSPEGETLEDRYSQHGYDCRVQVSGSRYMTGAENIAYTYADTQVIADSGGTVDYDGNETRIARGLVRQWMNSPGHRENILRPYWNNEGIGVATAETSEGTRVYATQNFC